MIYPDVLLHVLPCCDADDDNYDYDDGEEEYDEEESKDGDSDDNDGSCTCVCVNFVVTCRINKSGILMRLLLIHTVSTIAASVFMKSITYFDF